MSESQFLPSSLYGLSPTQLAAQVAQTNATIAKTQATRQSMMESVQQMQIEQAREKRAQQQFETQQAWLPKIQQAAFEKSKADTEAANAHVTEFNQKQDFRRRVQEAMPTYGDELMKAAQIPDHESAVNEFNRISGKYAWLYADPEGGGKEALNALNTLRSTRMAELQGKISFDREMEKKRMDAEKTRIETEQKEQAEQDKSNRLIQQQADQFRYNALKDAIATKRKLLDDKIANGDIDPKDEKNGGRKTYWDEVNSIYDLNAQLMKHSEDMMSRAKNGYGPQEEAPQKVRQKSTGKIGYIVDGQFIPEGDQAAPVKFPKSEAGKVKRGPDGYLYDIDENGTPVRRE